MWPQEAAHPFATYRPLGGAQFFMVTPQAPVKLHRVENDELYHYYGGDPIEVLACSTRAAPASSP